ncbi:farnesyl pyrophosphate synthase-like [Hyperolius riggenbachi]|uniref:farnesyl pyrophosphate synthase-like n=1 Tax=Hyperolius riggenbachi TaxID=752182 RepID=UPI0035A39AB9
MVAKYMGSFSGLDSGDDPVGPLEYWFKCLGIWSELAQYALEVLYCPPSSMLSERCFSAASGVVTEKRSRLSPESVDRLTFLKINQALIEGTFLAPVGDRMSNIKAFVDHPKFRSFFETIVKDLTSEYWGHPEIGDSMSRLKEVLEYIATTGYHHRGMSVLASFQELAGPALQKEDIIQRVLAVSWCVELHQAFMTDDILDHSETRLGKPCWYKKDGIGMGALNDISLLESCTYQILKKYCRRQPYYLNLLELFLESSYQAQLGQSLDIITSELGKVNLEGFTEARYKALVKQKNDSYAYYMPVAAAMYMAGIDDEEAHRNAKTILDQMAEFVQNQDDYEDCFGDTTAMGETGNDIEVNKCSWLVVEALKRVTPEQRRILQENYGKKDPEKVQWVKQLYEELDLPTVYRKYEEEIYQKLQALISQHANGLPKEIFQNLVRILFKRQI